MSDIYFDKVIQIGRLYLDYIFYEFESEPILFSCVDDEKKLYLCLCSEIRYGQKWVITECELSTLKALIDEKMDIASAFLLKNEIIIIDMDLQGKESSYVIRSEEIDRLDLPKEGMYIKDNKESARNYLWSKKCRRLLEKIEVEINMTQELNDVIKSYTSIINNKIDVIYENIGIYTAFLSNVINKQVDELGGTLEQSAVIEQEYSIETKEKYVEVIDSVELSNDDDGFLQAA